MSKLGIALGGGGARGLAHIGVLKVLDQEGIKIHSITGCSMGSIVGALYSYFGNAEEMENFILNIIQNTDFGKLGFSDAVYTNGDDDNYFNALFDYVKIRYKAFKSLSQLSFLDDEKTQELFDVFPDVPIEKFGIKFSAIATNLITGEEELFTRGSLRHIIRASSAIPGMFPPVRIENKLLVDGSVSESIPAIHLKELGADRILAIDVSKCLRAAEIPKNIFEVLVRSGDIASFHLSQERVKVADIILRPKVKQLKWSDFDRTKKIIAAGEHAAKTHIKKIKTLVNRSSYLLKMDRYFKKVKSNNITFN